jgi:hypothetical protein
MNKAVLAFLFIASFNIVTQAQSPTRSTAPSPFQPIQSGYGANGQFAVTEDKFPSPLFGSQNVHVFRPAGVTAKVPVIFFAPGYGNYNPDEYEPLINHIVSRGFALVYAPFQIISSDITLHRRRYDTIFAGFEEAVKRYGASFDLTRVGYAGHSYGAAASPSMSLRGLERGWGKDGLFIFAMAPGISTRSASRSTSTSPRTRKCWCRFTSATASATTGSRRSFSPASICR